MSPFCSPPLYLISKDATGECTTRRPAVTATARVPENQTILFKFKNDTHIWPLWTTDVAHALAYLVFATDVGKRAAVETTMSGVPAAAAIASRTWPLSDRTTRPYRTSSCDSCHWYDVNQPLLPRLAISHTHTHTRAHYRPYSRPTSCAVALRNIELPICKPVYVYFAKSLAAWVSELKPLGKFMYKAKPWSKYRNSWSNLNRPPI